MLIKIPRGWEIPERDVTPENVYFNRRKFLAGASAGLVAGAGGLILPGASAYSFPPGKDEPMTVLAPLNAPRNPEYKSDRPITSERVGTGYNNYYEFTEVKDKVKDVARRFKPRPW